MAGLAHRKRQVSCELNRVVRKYSWLFGYMRVDMANKALAILKFLPSMTGMTIYTALYLEVCSVTFKAGLVLVGTIRD